jgi:UDP-glucose:(heptosyl)LPS alpha-1,3-glucosyltransferase
MRVALVIDHFDPRRGGAELWACQHAALLLDRGHEVHLVSQEMSGPARRLGVVPHCLGPIRSVLGRAVAAEAKLRTLDVDVIHDFGMGWYNDVLQSPDGSRLAQWDSMLRLLPEWVRPWKRAMISALPRYRDFRRLMARQFADAGQIVLAISRMCARDYQRYHAVSSSRIRLVYHGVDGRQFSPENCRLQRESARHRMNIPPSETVFLFVGHDYRRKGLATAVRAVDRLAGEGSAVRLVVVGKQRHNQPIWRSHRAAVTMAGATDDPLPYYAAADAVVLPTFYDPFALVVLEAAACGLPIVTTRMAGASELLSDGRDGFVIADAADDVELAARMRQLLDPALRRRMGAAARELALDHSADRSCDEIVSIYDDISAQRRRGGRRETSMHRQRADFLEISAQRRRAA